jgi:ABC-type glutathione transport system ATPase component
MNDSPGSHNAQAGALLRIVNLRKRFTRGGGWARSRTQVEPLRGIDLAVRAGVALALIGVSGSGKSTLARCLACLEPPDSGEIWFAGKNLALLRERELALCRRKIQLIFQDPALSLNPRFTAAEIVSEPLLIGGVDKKPERTERAVGLMKLVGLPTEAAGRRPGDFSGGQRRRLAIARALAVEPEVLILDEALAGLDLSTQAQIANLLLDLQEARSLTYLWISHDLSLVARLASQVAVIDEGRIVESTSTRELFANPQSRQARVLVDATLAWPVRLA